MNSCTYIRVKDNPNTEFCDKYLIAVPRISYYGKVEFTNCGGDTETITMGPGEYRNICVQAGSVPTSVTGNVTISLTGKCSDISAGEFDDPTYLDLDEGFSFRETKKVTELTKVGKFQFNYTMGFSIPNTEHNFSILKALINPNVLDNQYQELQVEVGAGSHIVTDASLYIKNYNSSSFNVELRLSLDHWARASKDLFIRDLYPELITTDEATIKNIIETEYPYADGNSGTYWPMVSYGRLIQDPNTGSARNNSFMMPLELWRPWFYVNDVLKRGFCEIGWNFSSPLLESDLGKKLVTYLFNRSYGLEGQSYLQRKENLNVRASIPVDISLWKQYSDSSVGVIRFPLIETDPLSSLDYSGIYSASGEVNARGKVILDPPDGDDLRFTFMVAKIKEGTEYNGNKTNLHIYDQQDFSGDGPHTYEFDVEGISMTKQEKLAIMVRQYPKVASAGIVVKATSYLEIEGVRPYMIDGESESLRDMIDAEYDFLSLIKGLAHVGNLRFVTDWSTKTVYLYQPYEGDFWGETIEGFYLDQEIEDITDLIIEGTEETTSPNLELPRYRELLFKESDDVNIEELELAKELWSRKVDLGEKFTVEESEEYRNEFFEPLYNNIKLESSSKTSLHIPIMRGEDEFSFHQGPRIAICYGNVTQDPEGAHQPQLRYMTWDDNTYKRIPTVSQFVPIKLGTIHNNETAPTDYVEDNLVFAVNPEVYGYDSEKTLYHLMYKRYFNESLNNISIQFLTRLEHIDHLTADFRKLYQFEYLGRTVIARMQEIIDFHFCADLTTPINFAPLRQVSDLCQFEDTQTEGDTIVPLVCRNNPIISSAYDSGTGCFVFTLVGTNRAPISAVSYEYRLEAGGGWVGIPNLTLISAEVCGVTDPFYIRATVTYSAVGGVTCSEITTAEKRIEPCPDYELQIECTPVLTADGSNGMMAIITMPVDDTVTIVSSTSSVDGGASSAYSISQDGNRLIGELVTGENYVDFDIILEFGNCPAVNLTKTCNFGTPSDADCSLISLSLTCVEQDECIVFEKSGILPYEYDDHIKYRCSDDGVTWGPWLLWDNQTPVCCPFIQAQWFVQFCNDICPFTCSEVVSCIDCLPFQTGTQTSALCNLGNI